MEPDSSAAGPWRLSLEHGYLLEQPRASGREGLADGRALDTTVSLNPGVVSSAPPCAFVEEVPGRSAATEVNDDSTGLPPASAMSRRHLASVFALVLAGIGLRAWQFGANPSVWLDEVAIARNIFDRQLVPLLTAPLDYGQTAPPGFLIAEKTATLVMGPTDRALRLFPFACAVAAVPLFALLAHQLLRAAPALVALALFVAAFPLTYFTTQAKQYSSDVLVIVILLLCALQLRSGRSAGQQLGLATTGAILPWFSQPGALTTFAVGAVCLWWTKPRDSAWPRRDIALVVSIWVASAAAAVLWALSIVPEETRDYLQRFWATGFLPQSLDELVRRRWPWDQIRDVIGIGAGGGGRLAVLAYPAPVVYLALAGLGIAAIAKRDRFGAALVAAPVAITLVAAIARQYPFSDRLILFLLPCFFLAIGGSVEWLDRLRVPRLAVAAVSLAVVVPAVWPSLRTLPPYHTEPIKAAMLQMEAARHADDPVYVYYGGKIAADIYVSQLGLSPGAFYAGSCHRGDNRGYLEELDTFRGQHRMWLLITHALPSLREREDMLRYLDRIGTRREEISIPSRRVGRPGLPAEAFLYDLSDPARLALIDSSSFEVSVTGGRGSLGEPLTCSEGPAATATLHMAGRLGTRATP